MSTEALSKPRESLFHCEEQLDPPREIEQETRVERVALESITAQANVEAQSKTPPSTPERPLQPPHSVLSPSILASPQQPLSMHPYHTLQGLVDGKKKDFRGFKGKQVHSLVMPGSAEKQADMLVRKRVADHTSRCSRALRLGVIDEAPHIEPEPGIKIKVPAPDIYEVENTRKGTSRRFGLHRQKDGKHKRIFPVSGSGIVKSSKSSPSKPSPNKLLIVRDQMNKRRKTEGKKTLEELFHEEWASVQPPPITHPLPLPQLTGEAMSAEESQA